MSKNYSYTRDPYHEKSEGKVLFIYFIKKNVENVQMNLLFHINLKVKIKRYIMHQFQATSKKHEFRPIKTILYSGSGCSLRDICN